MALISVLGVLAKLEPPPRVDFKALINGCPRAAQDLMDSLTQVGLVSMTNVPNVDLDFAWFGKECLTTQSSMHQVLSDGTERRTLASQTLAGVMDTKLHQTDLSRECLDKLDHFRQGMEHATRVFSQVVSRELNISQALLFSSDYATTYSTFEQLVQQGHHLEHFHSYYKHNQTTNASTQTSTLDLHTDQGLFIAFCPGRYNANEYSRGFFIHDMVELEFSPMDNVVFMLGDAINDVVNTHLPRGYWLRAVPHTLRLDAAPQSSPRFWFGRMILPPPDAFSDQYGMTFGELHATTDIDDSTIIDVGCSRRQLQTTCSSDLVYCWHRCMVPANFSVSPEICSQTNQTMWCADSNGTLWDFSHNAKWGLYCVDDAPVMHLNDPEPAPAPTATATASNDAVMSANNLIIVVLTFLASMFAFAL